MEIFTFMRSHLKYMGVLKWELPPSYRWVPSPVIQRVYVICSFSISIVTLTAYLITNTKQLTEMSQSIVYIFTHMTILTWYLLSTTNSKSLERIFQDSQDIINASNEFCKISMLKFHFNKSIKFCVGCDHGRSFTTAALFKNH